MKQLLIRCLSSVFLVVSTPSVFAQKPLSPWQVPHFAAVLSSPDVKERLTTFHLDLCMQEAARVMGTASSERPRVAILQLSANEASRIGVVETTLMSPTGDKQGFYEVWLVEHDNLGELARAVEMVYEYYFSREYDDVTRGRVVHQIATQLHARLAAR